MHELAAGLEREMRESLLCRADERRCVPGRAGRGPGDGAVAAGLPAATAEPLLRALALRDEVLAKLPDVVAHQSEELPLKARLLILLLARPAVAEKIRARGA